MWEHEIWSVLFTSWCGRTFQKTWFFLNAAVRIWNLKKGGCHRKEKLCCAKSDIFGVGCRRSVPDGPLERRKWWKYPICIVACTGILHEPSERSICRAGVPCDRANVISRRGSRVKLCHQLVCMQHKCGILHPIKNSDRSRVKKCHELVYTT